MTQPALQRSAPPLRAQTQPGCIVCGLDHPCGLRIRYEIQRDGAVGAYWTPGREWEGFRGIVHGGIISTVLDEAMSKAVAAAEYEALTGELRVRFRGHVEPGDALRIRGWIVDRRKRRIRTEASVLAADGSERAHAWAVFLTLRQSPAPGEALAASNISNEAGRNKPNANCSAHQ